MKDREKIIEKLACDCFNRESILKAISCKIYLNSLHFPFDIFYEKIPKKFYEIGNDYVSYFYKINHGEINIEKEIVIRRKYCKLGSSASCRVLAKLLAKKSFKKHKKEILSSLKRSKDLSIVELGNYIRVLKEFVIEKKLEKEYYLKEVKKYTELLLKMGKYQVGDIFSTVAEKMKKREYDFNTAAKYEFYLTRSATRGPIGHYPTKYIESYPEYNWKNKWVKKIKNAKKLKFELDYSSLQDTSLLSCNKFQNMKDLKRYFDYCILEKEYKK